MATLATDVKWGSSPTNYFNFSYEKNKLSGLKTTQYYRITVECEPLTGASYFGYPIYVEINLRGEVRATTTLKSASPSQWSSALKYTTDWIPVKNAIYGTVPLYIRIYSGSGSTRDTTYQYNLEIDPAPSEIAATDANIESTSIITFTRYYDAFTHTLDYKPSGHTEFTNIFTRQPTTSYGWTVPKILYDYIPNKKEIEITLRCRTYDKTGHLVGENTCMMTATTAESKCAPSVVTTAEDVNSNTIALTGNNKKLIRFHSDVKATATATANNKSKISNVTLMCGGSTFVGTSYTFENVQSTQIKATATDSRGYSTTDNAEELSLIEYIKLTANSTAQRTNPTGDEVTFTTKGNYWPGNFGAASNSLTVQIAYKLQGTENFNSYADMTVTISENTYTATATLKGFDYTKNYDVSIRVQDKIYKAGGALADAIYNNFVLQKGIPVFDWGENDFNFNVPVNFANGLNIGNNKPYFEAGDTETIMNVFAGVVTSGGKVFVLNIPLAKPIVADKVSVSGEISGYGANGTVLNGVNLSGGTGYTLTVAKTVSGIRVAISYNAAQTAGVTNNAPITWFGTLTLTFA